MMFVILDEVLTSNYIIGLVFCTHQILKQNEFVLFQCFSSIDTRVCIREKKKTLIEMSKRVWLNRDFPFHRTVEAL